MVETSYVLVWCYESWTANFFESAEVGSASFDLSLGISVGREIVGFTIARHRSSTDCVCLADASKKFLFDKDPCSKGTPSENSFRPCVESP